MIVRVKLAVESFSDILLDLGVCPGFGDLALLFPGRAGEPSGRSPDHRTERPWNLDIRLLWGREGWALYIHRINEQRTIGGIGR
jgi:hypothetical protein